MGVEKQKPIDRRTYQRYIEKGTLKDSEFQSYLKHLPDETENAIWVDMDLFDTEIESLGETTDATDATDAAGDAGDSEEAS